MADLVTFTIDGRSMQAEKGTTVVQAAARAGIFIPQLCYWEGRPPYVGCRTCVVEIEGENWLELGCVTPVREGMAISSNSARVREMRRITLTNLLSEHAPVCLTCLCCDRRPHCAPGVPCLRHDVVADRCEMCIKNGRCELQSTAEYIDLRGVAPFPGTPHFEPVGSLTPFIEYDFNRCILCARCVQVCDETRVRGAIQLGWSGDKSRIISAFEGPFTIDESNCEFCGACVDVCPCAALTHKQAKQHGFPNRVVSTICPHCAVGCGLDLQIKNERVIEALPTMDNAASQGQLCIKGRFGNDFIHDPQRLTEPLVKRDGAFQPVSWEEALDYVAGRLAAYRGDRFGVLTSGRLTNEESYVLQKFARVAMGTNNVDQVDRAALAPSAGSLAESLGLSAATNGIAEVWDARCIVVAGADISLSHPVYAIQIKQAARKRSASLIVMSPRETEMCRVADMWLQLRPGTDAALLNAMMHVVAAEGLVARDFLAERCHGYAELAEGVREYSAERAEAITGVPADEIREAARLIAQQRPTLFFRVPDMGEQEYGAESTRALANLAMLTGNIGVRGGGVNLVRGACNAQGAEDMGCLPDALPGGQNVESVAARSHFADAWGVQLPRAAGRDMGAMLEAALARKMAAMYIVAANPAPGEANGVRAHRALQELEFLVVQDLFLSETAQLADVVLPACSFAEKAGTFTSAERRVQLLRPAIAPFAASRPDWAITCALARLLGAEGFAYADPAAIMDEIAALVPAYGGINHVRLTGEAVQWPCPSAEHPGTSTLLTDGDASGRWRLIPAVYRPGPESTDAEHPLLLSAARTLFQFDLGGRTPPRGLAALPPEDYVEVHPADADPLGLEDGGVLRISSRHGEVTARARVTTRSAPGVVSMPFQFAKRVANVLTGSGLGQMTSTEISLCHVRLSLAS